MYGFNSGRKASLKFGINEVKMTKFQYNPHYQFSDGSTKECLEITFNLKGTEIRYNQFPVTEAFDKQNNKVTDPSHEAMQKAFREFNNKLSQLVSCFIDEDQLKANLSTNINGFAHFCEILTNSLPEDFRQKRLHVFGQYQWKIKPKQKITYVELPKKVNLGLCFVNAEELLEPRDYTMFKYDKDDNVFIDQTGEEFEVEDSVATLNGVDIEISKFANHILFISEEGEVHPMNRGKWFAESVFARQQRKSDDDDLD